MVEREDGHGAHAAAPPGAFASGQFITAPMLQGREAHSRAVISLRGRARAGRMDRYWRREQRGFQGLIGEQRDDVPGPAGPAVNFVFEMAANLRLCWRLRSQKACFFSGFNLHFFSGFNLHFFSGFNLHFFSGINLHFFSGFNLQGMERPT